MDSFGKQKLKFQQLKTRFCVKSVRLLREEREQDEKLRNQYKQKWNRTPSEQLTKQLTDDQTKYLALLQRSKEADIKVKTQFENTIDYMRILSLSKVCRFWRSLHIAVKYRLFSLSALMYRSKFQTPNSHS